MVTVVAYKYFISFAILDLDFLKNNIHVAARTGAINHAIVGERIQIRGPRCTISKNRAKLFYCNPERSTTTSLGKGPVEMCTIIDSNESEE